MPVKLLTPASPSSSFADNVEQLVLPALTDADPLYILLKRHAAAPRLAAVSYIPDAARVRQKMLFASTRLALVRELGREHFRETIFATARDEVTPAGFERHDRHERLEAPLTEEERSLEGVRRAEAEEGGRGTATREVHPAQQLAAPVHDDALVALRELAAAEGEKRVVVLVSLADSPASPRREEGGGAERERGAAADETRKSTPALRRSSSSPSRHPRPPYPSWSRGSLPPSHGSPSTATSTSTAAARARRCCSSTPARRPKAGGRSRTACCIP